MLPFGQIAIIALVLVTVTLTPLLLTRIKLFDHSRQSIPAQAAIFTNRRTKTRGVVANEVHVQGSDKLAAIFYRRKTQDQMGHIFDIDLQTTLPAERGLYQIDFAENPAQIVKLVAQFKQHTATEFSTCRNPLPIVGVGTPR